ncbi:MAG TPA: hypothetical protein VGH16_22565 [Candidatus Binatia bacterium]|jgi:hypothetical protein
MKRAFYAIGLLAWCFHSALNAGEVDPEKRGGTANQEQRSGSATGSASTGTGAAAGPKKEAKAMSLRQITGTVVDKSGSEIKIKTGASEKILITDFKTKGLDNAKNGAKVAVRYYEDDGKLRAAEIAPR